MFKNLRHLGHKTHITKTGVREERGNLKLKNENTVCINNETKMCLNGDSLCANIPEDYI